MDKILKQPFTKIQLNYSENINTILQMALDKNPETRASVDDILMLPFIFETVFLLFLK